MMPLSCMQCVIMGYPDHSNLFLGVMILTVSEISSI